MFYNNYNVLRESYWCSVIENNNYFKYCTRLKYSPQGQQSVFDLNSIENSATDYCWTQNNFSLKESDERVWSKCLTAYSVFTNNFYSKRIGLAPAYIYTMCIDSRGVRANKCTRPGITSILLRNEVLKVCIIHNNRIVKNLYAKTERKNYQRILMLFITSTAFRCIRVEIRFVRARIRSRFYGVYDIPPTTDNPEATKQTSTVCTVYGNNFFFST